MSDLGKEICDKLNLHFEGSINEPSFSVKPHTISRKYQEYKGFQITYVQMYEAKVPDGYNFLSFIEKIREISGLQHIDLSDEVSQGGCETCDYGSSYGWDFFIWNGGIE